MMRLFNARTVAAIAIIASSLLTGCASIVNGTSQVVTVETKNKGVPVSGAACKLENGKGTFYVTTPGTVTIHRAFEDLIVRCNKGNIAPGSASVKSSTKSMAFGNILFGGLIGVAIDSSSGAAFDYPPVITINMGENIQIYSSQAVTQATASATTADAAVAPAAQLPSEPNVYLPKEPVSGSVAAPSELHLGTSSVTVERMARERGCVGSGANLITEKGPLEEYEMLCEGGVRLKAKCELRQCRFM